MRIHCLQHVAFEGLANIEQWAIDEGYAVTKTHLYRHATFPNMDEFDWLIIMGGPMGAYEEEKYPWLVQEKQFVAEALAANKKILGICLGAQILASVMGAKVYPNVEQEIGWFPVRVNANAKNSPIFSIFPEVFTPLHWHGDTFDLPTGCVCTMSSDYCANQAYYYGDRVFGLQFHIELLPRDIRRIYDSCCNTIPKGARCVQDVEHVLSQNDLFSENARLLKTFLRQIALLPTT